jgi:hypoxanthine phosphoribosyltransferase
MIPVDWLLIQQGCKHLADKIPNTVPRDSNGQYHLWGIPRAGMIVATTLHHYLPECQIHYMQTRPRIKNLIVVDEIADTGATFLKLVHGTLLRDFYYVTVFKRYTCPLVCSPDLFYLPVEHNDYLLMPWEQDTKR